jgi:hypothetical protein
MANQVGQQGTQFDPLGHFAALGQPWDGKPPFPAGQAVYYGGFTQQQVKPSADSPLQRLGMDKVPPIVTSAVLLDAKAHVGKGRPMKAGELVSALASCTILPLREKGAAGSGVRPVAIGVPTTTAKR